MAGDIAIIAASGSALEVTANDFKGRYKRIYQLMEEVMVRDEDYGKIPGCGDRPTLLKPGSEKLLMLFQLGAEPEVEDLSNDDCARYRTKCKIFDIRTGNVIGYGIGEASSSEEKYKWRKVICDEEFNEADPSRRREVWKRGSGGSAYQVKQIRTNPADVANTVLKMSKKRSQIDGTVTALAASQIFGQDLEDMDQAIREAVMEGDGQDGKPVKPSAGKPAVRQPQAKPAAPAAEKSPEKTAFTAKLLKPETVSALVDMMDAMGWNSIVQTGRLKWADSATVGDEKALADINAEYKKWEAAQKSLPL